MQDITFKTTNENKEFSKPLIKSGEYDFKIVDIKPNSEKSKNFFILEIIGQIVDEEQVSLVWSAPVNEEYTPGTNVGKLLLSMGFDLGSEIKAASLINMKGKCLVNDYSQQINGKVVTYSVVGDLVIPQKDTEE